MFSLFVCNIAVGSGISVPAVVCGDEEDAVVHPPAMDLAMLNSDKRQIVLPTLKGDVKIELCCAEDGKGTSV